MENNEKHILELKNEVIKGKLNSIISCTYSFAVTPDDNNVYSQIEEIRKLAKIALAFLETNE